MAGMGSVQRVSVVGNRQLAGLLDGRLTQVPMWNVAGIAISTLAAGCGLLGIFRPELFARVVQEDGTLRTARITGIVLLLLGIAGLIAILSYRGGGVDFFPA